MMPPSPTLLHVRSGARVTTSNVSADGPTTLDAALAGGIDLIVLDLGLPRLDGLEVCRRLRSEGQSVPGPDPHGAGR